MFHSGFSINTPVSFEGVRVGKLLLKHLLFNIFWVPVPVQKLIKTNLGQITL